MNINVYLAEMPFWQKVFCVEGSAKPNMKAKSTPMSWKCPGWAVPPPGNRANDGDRFVGASLTSTAIFRFNLKSRLKESFLASPHGRNTDARREWADGRWARGGQRIVPSSVPSWCILLTTTCARLLRGALPVALHHRYSSVRP